MSSWTHSPAEVFAASPLIPVMVISDLAQALPMAEALLAGGIPVFEITLRTPVALAAIELIAQAMPHALVGAGTVINASQYDAAVAAGARFALSPGMTPTLLAHAAKGRAPLIPGVTTPSEVMQALEAGYDHLKFFPAEASGGASALAAIAAPLPQARFCPTGGVGPHNLADYLALPCVPCVGGTWMLPAAAIQAGQWEQISQLARQAVSLAHGPQAPR